LCALANLLASGSTLRSDHNLGGWRCRLNLSMFLLTISVGRFCSVQSVLEFSAMKKNLRIMSGIERVFWTVLFRMASQVFLFFTPSDSSLVRNSTSPFTQCHVCENFMTSDGLGSPCALFTCSAGSFAPTDLVSITADNDKRCMQCPYNSISSTAQNVCEICALSKYANVLKTVCATCTAADLAKVYPYIETLGYGSAQWTWLAQFPLRSIRSPCTCDSEYMTLTAGGGLCTICGVAQISHLLDLLLTVQGTAFTYKNVVYNLLLHPTQQGLCKSCDPGYRSDLNPADQCVRCEKCTVGKYKDFLDQFQCAACRTGTFASTTGQTLCVSCAKCR